MASLKKFTVVDPSARVNLSFKESTRVNLESYKRYYLRMYGESCERSELVEQLLAAWFDQDADFTKFLKGLKEDEKASIKKAVTGEASDDKPAAPAQASVRPAYGATNTD